MTGVTRGRQSDTVLQRKLDAPGGAPVEDHIVADTQTPDDAAALRSVLARQYGHFAEHLSRASFEMLIDELALARMPDSLGLAPEGII